VMEQGGCATMEILGVKSILVSRFALVRRDCVADIDTDAGMENPAMEGGLNVKNARAAALLSFMMESN